LEKKEIRRCSAKEGTCYASTARRAADVEKLKVGKRMKDIETNMTSAKAFNEQNTDEYIHYILYN
jgi:hypothetical protein